MTWYASLPTKALGRVWAAMNDKCLCTLAAGITEKAFLDDLRKRGPDNCFQEDETRLSPLFKEIEAYLAGSLRTFTTPVDWSTISGFQKDVLQITFAIPYGETRTYQQIADQLGRKGAARAVGRAEATNPIPLVIPCHRVIGSDGSLHGYGMGSGIATKHWLLNLEGATKQISLKI